MRFLNGPMILVLLVLWPGPVPAGPTASSSGINNQFHRGTEARPSQVLLLETTTTAIPEALNALGVSYDEEMGPPWPEPGCDHLMVILAMDGGLLEASDIGPLAAYASAGGNLAIYGGSCWQDYVLALDQYLVRNDTNNYCWAEVSGYPEMRIVDPNDLLSENLPSTYNWQNPAASFYQLRVTDPSIATAALNCDGYPMLFSKRIGSGLLAVCIDSPYGDYYAGQDFAVLTQIVSNLCFASNLPGRWFACCLPDGSCTLADYDHCADEGGISQPYSPCCDPNPCSPPVPVEQQSWGRIKGLYR